MGAKPLIAVRKSSTGYTGFMHRGIWACSWNFSKPL